MHGGIGFQHRKWTLVEYTENSITLSYFSPSGEDGFPSNLSVFVNYTLKNFALQISYKAIPEETTPIALTNHAFFNLDGLGGDIKSHIITIWADKYSETGTNLIPTGNRPSVNGTQLDLRCEKMIGSDFSKQFQGYDHNMILSPQIYKNVIVCGDGKTAQSVVEYVTSCGGNVLPMDDFESVLINIRDDSHKIVVSED